LKEYQLQEKQEPSQLVPAFTLEALFALTSSAAVTALAAFLALRLTRFATTFALLAFSHALI